MAQETDYTKGILIKLSVDFSAEIFQVRREWNDILTVQRGKPANQETVPWKGDLQN